MPEQERVQGGWRGLTEMSQGCRLGSAGTGHEPLTVRAAVGRQGAMH